MEDRRIKPKERIKRLGTGLGWCIATRKNSPASAEAHRAMGGGTVYIGAKLKRCSSMKSVRSSFVCLWGMIATRSRLGTPSVLRRDAARPLRRSLTLHLCWIAFCGSLLCSIGGNMDERLLTIDEAAEILQTSNRPLVSALERVAVCLQILPTTAAFFVVRHSPLY